MAKTETKWCDKCKTIVPATTDRCSVSVSRGVLVTVTTTCNRCHTQLNKSTTLKEM